jgi:phosphoglycolate phosphatase-like HAD superfamily hydrolase
MNIRAVIFDRDNTLVYFDPVAITALEARVATNASMIPPGAAAANWNAWPGTRPQLDTEEP